MLSFLFRLSMFALSLSATALAARADVFDLASGTWGLIDHEDLSCAVNPHRISFSADQDRALFLWDHPMLAYDGEWRREGGYRVLSHDAQSITMALDGELRLTEAGEPVVWVLRLLAGGTRYCWGRKDWPEDRCIDRYIRCPGAVPVS